MLLCIVLVMSFYIAEEINKVDYNNSIDCFKYIKTAQLL